MAQNIKKLAFLASFVVFGTVIVFPTSIKAEENQADSIPKVTESSIFQKSYDDSYLDGLLPQYNNLQIPRTRATAVISKTQSQALSWVNAQKGKAIDVDGYAGAQCVDLTMAYSEYLYGIRTFGNGADYATNNYSGFTKLSKTQTNPQAGDIVVWIGGYGHVGIVISSSGTNFTTLEQNINGIMSVQQYSRNMGNIGNLSFWAVQRPTYKTEVTIPTITNAVYRMYNANNGDHYYTANHAEAVNLQQKGLSYDGVFFYSVASGGTQIYKAYNPNTGEHFYTANKAEIENLAKAGWNNEGNAWQAPTTGNNVYRVYNPSVGGFHMWTTNQTEVNSLVAAGWKNEGTAFKG